MRNHARAFTLIEVLVYIAVFSMLMVAVTSFVHWSVRAANKARAVREVLRNAEQAMDTVGREIREAKSVYGPTSNSAQISLETRRSVPDNDAVTYVDIYQCATALCIKREGGPATLLTADSVEVIGLNFSTVGAASSTVTIDLAVRYKNPSPSAEYDAALRLNSSVSVRGF